MDQRNDDPLHRRLDRLEDKGRAALVAVARRVAWADAVRIAARVSVAAPLVLMMLAFFRPIEAGAAILCAVAIPCVVLAMVYGLRVARLRVPRAAALAWIDRTAALKDRAVIAAEFAGAAGHDGFRAAAIDEARPWLERAETAPLAPPSAPMLSGRLWAWPACAALILSLADRKSVV